VNNEKVDRGGGRIVVKSKVTASLDEQRIHPRKTKWKPPARANRPDLTNCATIEDLVLTTCDNLHAIASRGMSAFWMILSKLVQNQGSRQLRTTIIH
jgi:hypothetical protein